MISLAVGIWERWRICKRLSCAIVKLLSFVLLDIQTAHHLSTTLQMPFALDTIGMLV
jgi:hypothetical protein